MSWADLVESIRPSRPPAHVNLVLCGRAAAQLPRLPGPALSGSEVVTFHRARYAGDDDDLTGVLDVIRLAVPDETLAKHATLEPGICVTVITLDWLEDTRVWPATLEQALQTVGAGAKLVLTAVNFERAAKLWRSSAVLSEKIDACHQFLRVSALQHAAALVYTTASDAELDWLAIVSHVSGVPFTVRPAPAEQLVADPVFAVYGGAPARDSREHIMALNASFDFDAAVQGTLQLESLVEPASASEQQTQLSLEAVLAEFDEKNHDARMSEDTAAESHRLVYDGVGTGATEDRRVISEFFTKIAQRST